jgi:catechol 2,3-dioxygenase-like lactoylglutathione lyase family enzyme
MIKVAIPILHISDPALAECFYCGELGFEKTFAYQPFGETGPCYFGIVRDGVSIHLSSFPGDGVAGSAVSLKVDNLDKLFEEYNAKHIRIDLPPTDQSWGNREMYINDPDNNSIRFIQWSSGQ